MRTLSKVSFPLVSNLVSSRTGNSTSGYASLASTGSMRSRTPSRVSLIRSSIAASSPRSRDPCRPASRSSLSRSPASLADTRRAVSTSAATWSGIVPASARPEEIDRLEGDSGGVLEPGRGHGRAGLPGRSTGEAHLVVDQVSFTAAEPGGLGMFGEHYPPARLAQVPQADVEPGDEHVGRQRRVEQGPDRIHVLHRGLWQDRHAVRLALLLERHDRQVRVAAYQLTTDQYDGSPVVSGAGGDVATERGVGEPVDVGQQLVGRRVPEPEEVRAALCGGGLR